MVPHETVKVSVDRYLLSTCFKHLDCPKPGILPRVCTCLYTLAAKLLGDVTVIHVPNHLPVEDVDLAEVHDCFTIAEIVATEDLGFCKKGDGGKLLDEGATELTGRIPVNTSGGLKAVGHPVGATGVKQAIEIVLQLRGEADKRQVKDAKIGLTHNVGGSGATAVVHIFSR